MKRIEFVWPEDLVKQVDDARGDVPRTKWVRRVLEKALRVCSCGATGFGDERARQHGSECMYAPPPSVSPSERDMVHREAFGSSERLKSQLLPEPKIPGVRSARELAMERQRRMNERKS